MPAAIPFALSLPSLVTIRDRVRCQRPHATSEFVDAVAILAQCAYEDHSDWATGDGQRKALNPTEFRGDMLGLAAAYLVTRIHAGAHS